MIGTISRLRQVPLPFRVPPILATGGELKSAFALAQDDYADLSASLGDLQQYETLVALEQSIEQAEQVREFSPRIIAHDLHPDYLATRYALDRAARECLASAAVQHHHAHIAACMADNGHPGDRPVLGVALDGTGCGSDGAIWGGEFLLADYTAYHRFAHLPYVPLPGGDLAVRQPWRMALAWLHASGIEWDADLPPVRYARSQAEHALSALRRQLITRLNTPPTSSMGRLFDAVSALLGLCPVIEYEAQAAVQLERIADPEEPAGYPFDLAKPLQAAPRPARLIHLTRMFRDLVADFRSGIPLHVLSARFHNTIARLTVAVCREMRAEFALNEVALSGGVWQNRTLFQKTLALLEYDGFDVLVHRRVPTTDAGLPLGQVMVAGSSWR